MIHWLWLIPAAMLGGLVVGTLLCALFVGKDSDAYKN
jgi:hypothetical protein